MESLALVRDIGQWGIGSPAAFGRTAGNEKAGQHDHATHTERPETGGVYFRKGHVRRPDLERHDKIAEGGERDRHHAQKDHDGAVHCTERVVTLTGHHTFCERAKEGTK